MDARGVTRNDLRQAVEAHVLDIVRLNPDLSMLDVVETLGQVQHDLARWVVLETRDLEGGA